MEDVEKVLDALGKVIEQLKNNGSVSPDALVGIGEFCFSFGVSDDARCLFEEALSMDPANDRAINNLGVLNFQLGDYETARDFFMKAIELNPDDRVAKANLLRLIDEETSDAADMTVGHSGELAEPAPAELNEAETEAALDSIPVCSEPIFVVGSPRSGTSQLAHSLARHSQNWVSRESHFFNQLGSLAKELYTCATEWSKVSSTWWLAKEEVGIDEFMQFIGYGMNALFTNRSGGLCWIDHTPGYALILGDLGRLFPGARFIHIIRDGRDVVNSMIHSQHHRDVGCDWACSFETACRAWLQHVESALDYETVNPHRILRVYYESISSGSGAQFRRILRFLKQPYESAITEPFGAGKKLNSSFSETERDRLKWQNSWSDEQKSAFVAVSGDLLVRLGYENDDSWAGSSVLASQFQGGQR